MWTFFIFYLLGVGIVGFINTSMYMLNSYHDFRVKDLEALKQAGSISTDDFSNDEIFTMEIIVTSILSWLGLIFTISNIIAFISGKNIENN